ncbi:MAG: cupin domain-containing protein [Candidatus Brockarchaeota archaeon]|nr:cupin domain-containing protein [Candidatus Brockarchaeota archaeon]
MEKKVVSEKDVEMSVFADRWSKELLADRKTGFSLGVAEYGAREFGTPQVHEDQEALYVVSGFGQIRLDGEAFDVRAGTAVYVPPGCKHAARATGPEPLKVVYAHAAITS